MDLWHLTWAMGMALWVGCFSEKWNNCGQNCKIELIMRLLRQKGNFAAQIEWSSYSRQGDGYWYCLEPPRSKRNGLCVQKMFPKRFFQTLHHVLWLGQRLSSAKCFIDSFYRFSKKDVSHCISSNAAAGRWNKEGTVKVSGTQFGRCLPSASKRCPRGVPFGRFFLFVLSPRRPIWSGRLGRQGAHIWNLGSSEMGPLRHCLASLVLPIIKTLVLRILNKIVEFPFLFAKQYRVLRK